MWTVVRTVREAWLTQTQPPFDRILSQGPWSDRIFHFELCYYRNCTKHKTKKDICFVILILLDTIVVRINCLGSPHTHIPGRSPEPTLRTMINCQSDKTSHFKMSPLRNWLYTKCWVSTLYTVSSWIINIGCLRASPGIAYPLNFTRCTQWSQFLQ